VAVLINAPAFADVNDLGFYVGGRLLPAVTVVENESLKGGRGNVFRQLGENADTAIGAGILAGYHWHDQGLPIRTEVEYAYRFRHDFDTEETGGPIIGYKNNLSTHSLMVSAFYDITTDSPWRPYVGAGVGWARNSSETTRATNDISDPDETIEADSDNLAYSIQAGFRVAITPNWVGELGYRFINFGEVESGQFSTGDSVSADQHLSHDIIMGVSYMF
jgi:opacity protein-like surface antigen